MSFCNKCGKEMPKGAKFCQSCGANNSEWSGSDLASKFEKFNDTDDKTAEYQQCDIEQNKFFAILAYIGILVLIPILAAPKSKFARFHANQGLILLICEAAYGVICSILVSISTVILSLLGVLASIIFGIAALIFIIYIIIGILNVANGRAKVLPLIGKFTILQ